MDLVDDEMVIVIEQLQGEGWERIILARKILHAVSRFDKRFGRNTAATPILSCLIRKLVYVETFRLGNFPERRIGDCDRTTASLIFYQRIDERD